MNRCVLVKQIHGKFSSCSGLDRWIKKDFLFPGVPSVGLFIKIDDIDEQIIEIGYEFAKSIFTCYAKPDKEIYDAQVAGQKHRSVDEILKEYLKEGWEIR